MPTSEYWDDPLAAAMLEPPAEALTEQQLASLWRMFEAIPRLWTPGFPVNLLRSRWIDMIEALAAGTPDYRGEYVNAAAVYEAMVDKLGEADADAKLYVETVIAKPDEAVTRLKHVKLYVANDFIRCFAATGGFRGFVKDARNYTGFMGGSRFREWAPVRTGRRL